MNVVARTPAYCHFINTNTYTLHKRYMKLRTSSTNTANADFTSSSHHRLHVRLLYGLPDILKGHSTRTA